MPKIVTVTLMRKNSSRLPGKNTKELGGIPLYEWTVATAKALCFPYVVYHNYPDLIVPHAINNVYQGDGITMDRLLELDAEIFVMLPVTSPFRDPEQIKKALQGFIDDKAAKVLIGVKECRPGLYYDGALRPLNFDPEVMPMEGAKRRTVYRECGSLYIFRRYQLDKFCFLNCAQNEKRFWVDPVGVDIDTQADWDEAERCLISR